MKGAPFDVSAGHRWFAVELNNFAWDLVEADQPSPEQVERMLHAAHGACFHWLVVGGPIQHMRAQCLLATAYAKAALPEAAVRHAERCLALGDDPATADQTPFDRATAHGCASAAYRLAGRRADAAREYQAALHSAVSFQDAEETATFERLYPAPT
jgi:hypothetical protein